MRFHVDGPSWRVVCGDRRWPFAVDCRDDSAAIDLDGTAYRVRPLRWREKRTLARFARLGESFLKAEFVRLSLAEPAPGPPDGEELDVLFALALWFNAPGEDGPSLPLEPRALARVTFDLCRVLGRAPEDFDARDASEVEWLWEASQAGGGPAEGPDEPATRRESEFEAARTTILVVPDPEPADRAPSEPVPPPAEPSQPDPEPLAALVPERAETRPEAPRPDRFRVSMSEPARGPAPVNGAGRPHSPGVGTRTADRRPARQESPRRASTEDVPVETPVAKARAEAPPPRPALAVDPVGVLSPAPIFGDVATPRPVLAVDPVGAPVDLSTVSLRGEVDTRPPRTTRPDAARWPWLVGAASFRPEGPAAPGLDEFADELIRAASLLGIDVED